MRNRLFFISIAILLLLPASLCAADDEVNIDGKWKCEAGGQGGNAKITLTFKVNGNLTPYCQKPVFMRIWIIKNFIIMMHVYDGC